MRKIFRQFVLIVLVSSSVCFAQTAGNAPSAAQSSTGSTSTGTPSAGGTDSEGREFGDYRVQQSVEFGYRFSEINGNPDVYNTFLNQHDGPRLLEQSLSVRSINGTGALFDDLSVNSFGWGGDPENVARARVSKNLWYDFSFLFRRDQNFFEYNLFANPLNPPTSNPNIPVIRSPHEFQTRRRMYDFDLTLLPQSKFTIRLGYSRNRSEGPNFSTDHEGTESLLNQAWNLTSNDYHIGFDIKVLPNTTISYDQYLEYDKNDTDTSLAPYNVFLLPNGQPVSLGVPFNTLANQPCAHPLQGAVANPACNGFFSYTNTQKLRTTTPTEQLTLRSNYFRRVSFVANGSYSSADLTSPNFEFFNGLVTRTGQRQFTTTGPSSVRRVAATADLGTTVEITRSIHLNETFRLDNWRIPGLQDSTTAATVGVPVGTPPAVTLLSPLGPTTTTSVLTATFLGQNSYYNKFEVEYSPSELVGVRVGYLFRHRHIFHAEPELPSDEHPFEPFEGDTIDINQQGPTFGVWMRPMDSLRINLEAEATTADNFLTRISPRQQQNYRARATYKLKRLATISATMNIWEARNSQIDVDATQHYRNMGASAMLFPNERFNLELNYNYTDALQNAFICYNGTFTAAGTVVGGCPTFDPANAGNNNAPNQIHSTYINNTNYGSFLLVFSPVKRLSAKLGYGITSTNGDTTILNSLQPLGPLQFTYHQPLASLSLGLGKGVSANAYWNYDQYGEGSFVGPTAPRYFHDNRTVLALRYAF
jgi:hypothetical protein